MSQNNFMRISTLLCLLLICSKSFSQVNITCDVRLNEDTTFQIKNPLLNSEFIKNVMPSLFYIPFEHNRSYGEYTIPFDSIAKVTGFYTLLGNSLIKPCCNCCPNDECADVLFNKILSSENARFIINFNNVPSSFYSVNATNNGYEFLFKMDKRLTGLATFSPNYVRFFFGEERIFLTIKAPTGEIVEDIIIGCITVSPNRIVYMPRSARPFTATHLPIIIYRN